MYDVNKYGNNGVGYNKNAFANNMKLFGSDINAYNQELQRVNSVIQNRKNSGMDITNQMNYLQQLQSVKPQTPKIQTQQTPQQPTYTAPQAPVFTAPPKMEAPKQLSIDDLAKQFGLDYSRESAQKQANAEAQAKRDAIQQGKRAVDARVESSADALDRNYFLKGLQQQQSQANTGLNAGIASDQDLRMAMARQANMGDIYRDANLEHMRLEDQIGRVELERLAREDGLYNDRRQQGFQNALTYNDVLRRNFESDRNFDRSTFESDRNFGRTAFESDRNFGRGVFESDRGFNESLFRDRRDFDRNVLEKDRAYDRGVFESDRGFNRGVLENDRNFDLNNRQFDWNKLLGEAQMTGMFNGKQTVNEQQRLLDNTFRQNQANTQNKQWQDQFDWNKHWSQHQFNNVDANTRASINARNSGGGGGGGGGGLTPYQQFQMDKWNAEWDYKMASQGLVKPQNLPKEKNHTGKHSSGPNWFMLNNSIFK